MKLLKFLTTLVILSVCASKAFATYGCFIPSQGRVYTSVNGNGKYKTSPFTTVGAACILGGGTPGTCRLTNNTVGQLGDYSISYCPLDDYVWCLIVGICLFFGYRLKRNLALG